MPSFFEGLKRMLQGKPVFTPEDMQPGESPKNKHPEMTPSPLPGFKAETTGPKILPQIAIEDTDCYENGATMQLDAIIQNNSSGMIELDKVKIFNNSRELDVHLQPGEERKCRLYDGPRPQNTNNYRCEVYYKDTSGDYFDAVYIMEFRRLADNTYVVERMRQERIQDI